MPLDALELVRAGAGAEAVVELQRPGLGDQPPRRGPAEESLRGVHRLGDTAAVRVELAPQPHRR